MMRILVIEDDDGVRESLAEILRDEAHEVALASSGEDALERLGDGPLPELILLDLLMPGMNGEAFREAQLRDGRLRAIPVIAISARVDLDRIAERLAIVDWLRKPMHVEDLLAHIDAIAAGRRS